MLHFIPISSIGNPVLYNNFRDQKRFLNQSSAEILLIGDSIISNLARYLEMLRKNFFPS